MHSLPGSRHLTRTCSHRRHCVVCWALVLSLVILAGALPVAAQSPADALTIDQLHIFAMPAGDHVVISEHYLLGNTGDVDYESSPTVSVSLPSGAYDVNVGGEDDPAELYEVTEDTVSTSRTIPTGSATSQVRFSYSLPLSLGTDIEREVPLPVNSCVILVAGERYELEGSQLISFGSMEVGGEPAHAYTLDPMVAGDNFSFALIEATEAMPVTEPTMGQAASPGASSDGLGLGAGALALAAAVVAVTAGRRHRGVPAPPPAAREVIVQLARLDERHDAGELTDAEHQDERESLIADLRRHLD